MVQIPVELEKLFVVLDHALPGRDQLEGIARELTSDQPGDLPTEWTWGRVLSTPPRASLVMRPKVRFCAGRWARA